MSPVDVVLGAQWGDEGKGKLVDLLSATANIVCRCQGGNNAGHTVVANGTHYFFHLLPSGVVNPNAIGVVGNGVVVNLRALFDEENRGQKSLGTTKRGIGPAYASKVNRNGLRICDLMGDWDKFCEKYRNLVEYTKRRYPKLEEDTTSTLQQLKVYREKLSDMVCDTVSLMNRSIADSNVKILVEGAQSCLLDIDFGTYPFVTSSNCSIGGVCTGLGIPPSKIKAVYGVVKAYTTRIGTGAFPTEIFGELSDRIQKNGKEFGVTTGRSRRIGWLDVVLVRYANMINNFTELALTKLDIMDDLDEIQVGVCYRDSKTKKELTEFPADCNDLHRVEVEYKVLPGWKQPTTSCQVFDDLPLNAQRYVEAVESLIGVHIRWIGVGPARASMIERGCKATNGLEARN